MARINKETLYLERRFRPSNKYKWRSIYLVRYHNKYNGIISIGKHNIVFPKELIGARVRIKVEVLGD